MQFYYFFLTKDKLKSFKNAGCYYLLLKVTQDLLRTGIKSAHLASCHQREIYKNRAMRQSCQIYLLNKETCNATVFITIQCCINDEIVSPLQHIPKFLNGVKVWTTWRPIHVWKWCLMPPERLFHNVSLMNPDIAILEYAHVIREENIDWWKRSQLTSVFDTWCCWT